MQLRTTSIRLAVCGVAAAGLVATLSVSASAAKKTVPVTEKGAITCRPTGTITFKPPIVLSSAKKTTMTIAGTLASCKATSPNKKVTLTGGKLAAKSVANMSCGTLENALPKLTGTITWKAKHGTVKATTFTFSAGSASFTSAPITFIYPKANGTGEAKGSFPARKATAHFVLKQTESQLIPLCTGGGLKTLNFTKSSSMKA